MRNALAPYLIDPVVANALNEDLGRAGDITTQAVISPNISAVAVLASRKPGICCGVDIANHVFEYIDPSIKFEKYIYDGDLLSEKSIIARIEGSAQTILTAERVALNFLGHLSGIATQTSKYVTRIAHMRSKICDTRKTTPTLRLFEKYAVKCGGGVNHRFGLDDAVLIKDNHIAIAGGVSEALKAVKKNIGHLVKIEIEVDTLSQLEEALVSGVDAILLDNMSLLDLTQAVRMIGNSAISEASGNVTFDTVEQIAQTGVDLISIGALTHSAPSLDVGLDVVVT